MEVEVARHVCLDVLEDAEKLLMPVAGSALRHHLADGDVERGEQRRRPMTDIVVGDALDVAEAERQHRLAAFEPLNLRLLVDAQDEGMVGRVRA